MKDIYLTKYSVRGIKSLDQLVELSFYKKTITKNPNTQDYNIKGIYGMNGSGKSGIIISVEILRNLLTRFRYLGESSVQETLNQLINKETEELFIEVEYMAEEVGDMERRREELRIFRYSVTLKKDYEGEYWIASESLSTRKATSRNAVMETVFKVCDGEIIDVKGTEDAKPLKENEKGEYDFKEDLINRTRYRLSEKSLCILSLHMVNEADCTFLDYMSTLQDFGDKLYVYLEESDNHRKHLVQRSKKNRGQSYVELGKSGKTDDFFVSASGNRIDKLPLPGQLDLYYKFFEKQIQKLYKFIHIFKPDLQGIEIDRKEDRDCWICDLKMVYSSYKIDAEFDSTGIKKLIKLFPYMQKMVRGGIVFVDELDSNLHDVYLCALLEYLMEYGEGQLCFTTHNVGPMDILKRNKKSIDFLSKDHTIYPWRTNGNYSPSKLYRNGMIEGSLFNVDSIDFIGIFDADEGEWQ